MYTRIMCSESKLIHCSASKQDSKHKHKERSQNKEWSVSKCTVEWWSMRCALTHSWGWDGIIWAEWDITKALSKDCKWYNTVKTHGYIKSLLEVGNVPDFDNWLKNMVITCFQLWLLEKVVFFKRSLPLGAHQHTAMVFSERGGVMTEVGFKLDTEPYWTFNLIMIYGVLGKHKQFLARM